MKKQLKLNLRLVVNKTVLFLLFNLLIVNAVMGQSPLKVRGVVTDTDNIPIIGATVMIKGTNNGTVTDMDGKFSLSVEIPEGTLSVSYIGYETEEVQVSTTEEIRITLKDDNLILDEVVVVGYGTQKKVNLTGSVVAVKGEELTKRPVVSTTLALQGIAPGVTISSTSGQPGSEGETVRVRGIGTLNNNDPLVLVDNVASSLNAVNANDIESISILKDAASSAIYGSRAANGVILITTKRAKEGKLSISLGGNLAMQSLIDKPKMLGAIDYLELYDLAVSNDTRNFTTGVPGGRTYGTDYINNYRKMMNIDPYLYPNTNWANVVFDDYAFQQQYNLSISGGTDKMRAMASLNVQDQDGVYPGTNATRYNIRLNTDYQISKKVSTGIDISARQSDIDQRSGMAVSSVYRTPSIFPYKTPDGKPAYNPLNSNPWATSQWDGMQGYADTKYHEVFVNMKLGYSPFDFLRFDLSYVPKFNFSSAKTFNTMIDYYDMEGNVMYTTPQRRSVRQTKTYQLNQDVKALVNFHKSFGKHNVAALGGFQRITNYYENLIAFRAGGEFDFDQIDANPTADQEGSGGANEWALQSWFGRINYDFLGKYLLEANLRYDGSSRFYKGYKWGAFPSFSAGWRFSEESFMKRFNWLSNAKLRASWGSLGNQEGVGNYAFSSDMNLQVPVVFNGNVAQGYAATDYAIQNISWETTTMTDIGFDLGLLNNKIEVVFDYYFKKTKDILMNLSIPGIMGYENSPLQNAGEVENKGWDLSLAYNDRKGDFSYRVMATLSDVKNKVIDMKGVLNNYSGVLTSRAGYPIGSLYGLMYDGMFPTFEDAKAYKITQFGNLQGGDIKYVDQLTVDTDGDGVPDASDGLISEADYVVMGNTIPRYTYSFDISAQYKGFDLGLFFQGVGKRDGYLSYDLGWAFNNGASVQQWQKDGMWQEGQTDANYPRMFVANANNIKPSSYWKQNAAYLRLKNAQFGYTLPRKLLRKTLFQDVRFYISGQNLLTFKHMKPGYDPEMPVESGSGQSSKIPLVRTYSFGFNVNF